MRGTLSLLDTLVVSTKALSLFNALALSGSYPPTSTIGNDITLNQLQIAYIKVFKVCKCSQQ